MPEYDNSNSGALFKNEQREKENHPHARGTCETVCSHCKKSTSFWLSAWTKTIKQGKKQGQKMQSLAFTQQDIQQTQETRDSGDPQPKDFIDPDEDVPF